MSRHMIETETIARVTFWYSDYEEAKEHFDDMRESGWSFVSERTEEGQTYVEYERRIGLAD